jgi:hypothetical protein
VRATTIIHNTHTCTCVCMYLYQAGSRSLVFDLSITHQRYGSSNHPLQNGRLTHPEDMDAALRLAAERKMNSFSQPCADNRNISFLPAIMTTSFRMRGEFLRLHFLQAHRETEAHFTAAGVPSQRNQSDSFCFKRAAFFQSLMPRLVVSDSTCPPLSPSPHANKAVRRVTADSESQLKD